MFVLKVLGGAVVEGASGPLAGRAAHRRRLALLVLLSTSPTGRLGRERLGAYLWPERDSERARHALSESLYVLRKALGENAFLTTGDDVGLNPDVVTSDVAGLETALAAGDLEHATALYTGPFLDGFFVDDAPDFERWAETERDRLARAYAAALEQLAEEREAEEDRLGALEWWRRLAAHDPYSSRIALRLMQALEAAGEHAAAIQHAAAHTALLQAELGVAPDSEIAVLAERLRAEPKGSVGVADARVHSRPAAPLPTTAEPIAPAAVTPPSGPPPGPGWRHRVPMFAGVVVILVAALGFGMFYVRPESEGVAIAEPALNPTRIAVLFFDDYTPGGELGYLANGVTSTLIHELSQIEALEVISENGVLPFRHTNVSPDSIARALGAGTIVSGSVSRSADHLRVNVRVIDAATSVNLASQVQGRHWSETFALIDDVVREVSLGLRRELGRNVLQVRGWQAKTSSLQAWQLTYQAAELRQSARELRAAGEMTSALARLESAEQLLAEAEALDPRWPDPIVVRGRIAQNRAFIAFHPKQKDLEAVRRWFDIGIAHADRALALDPDHAEALELRGSLRYRKTLFDRPSDLAVLEREIRAAEADLLAALAADRTRARAWTDLSSIEFDRGNFAAAKQAAERAYRMDAFATDVNQTLLRLFESTFELQEDREASRWCDEIRPRSDASMLYGFCALTLQAWSPHVQPDPAAAWVVLEEILAPLPTQFGQATRPRYEMLVAAVLARAGMRDSAEAVLQRAREASGGDPDLSEVEAGARILLGQPDRAIALLHSFGEARPERYQPVVQGRRFASVRDPMLAKNP